MFFGKPENYEWYAKRCAIYIRVSTEEQARHGYSLEAQLEELEAYAKQFCMQVVGIYTDDGVSARKEVHKRKGLSALLESVKRDETDYILFIKLDRWFRSVREYYKTQDILEAHGVGWKAILEDYDTLTTNGRLNLNIRLSVAQDESDRTGDRIRFVNESRVRNGGTITGSYPLALYSSGGKVCVDEEKAQIVKGIFSHYEDVCSVRNCIDYASNAHGLRLGYNVIQNILTNPLYIGEYRGNPEYCQPIITKEQFYSVQRLNESRKYTRKRSNFFIFAGILVCPVCDCKMGGWAQHDYKFDKVYLRYRCNRKWVDKICTHKFTPWEGRIEKYLSENIHWEIKRQLLSRNPGTKKRYQPKTDTAKIKRQLERLKNLYVEELIGIEEYRSDYVKLNDQLLRAESANKAIEAPPNIDALKAVLEIDFETSYFRLGPEERRRLWLSIIDHIKPIDKDTFEIVFL